MPVYFDPQAKLKQKYADFTGGRSYLEDCLFGMIDPDFINLSHTDAFRAEMGWDDETETESEVNTSTCTVEETITTESTMEEVSDSQDSTIMGEQGATYQHEFAGDPGFGDEYVAGDDYVEEEGWYTSDDEFPDPEHPPEVREAPGKEEQERTRDQIADFQRRWAKRSLDHLPVEEQDRLYIKHARRAGMTASAIEKANILKTKRVDTVGITYRMQKLKESGKDITPRTAQAAWQRYKMKNSKMTPATYETAELIKAMKNGKTVEEIVESDIVTVGINTRKAIRHRWDTYIRRNVTVPKIKSDRDELDKMKKQGVRKTQFKKGGAKNATNAGKKEQKQKGGKRDEEEEQTVANGVSDEAEDEAAALWFKQWDRIKVL